MVNRARCGAQFGGRWAGRGFGGQQVGANIAPETGRKTGPVAAGRGELPGGYLEERESVRGRHECPHVQVRCGDEVNSFEIRFGRAALPVRGLPVNLLAGIVRNAGLEGPDGRPLHRYPLSDKTFAQLQESLEGSAVSRGRIGTVAPAFVLWAAEHVRARYRGGGLTWAFVLEPLRLWTGDDELWRKLVKRGLAWWGRDIRRSGTGVRMFLYSLMAEGGIPMALLKQPGLYRDVVMGLLLEIEAEGGAAAASWSEQIAARWVSRLPQTFQGYETTGMLSGLTIALAELRAALPVDLPEAVAEQWLNENRPDWQSCIPLRMGPEIAESLIRPALQTARDAAPAWKRAVGVRELRRSEAETWHGCLRVSDESWVPGYRFPEAKDLRLRLLPLLGQSGERLVFSAVPESDGWRVRPIGRRADLTIPLAPDAPFALAAFADGRSKGSAVIDAGLPTAAEAPGFWRSADPKESADANRLVPLSGNGRTRSACLWVLAPEDVQPEAGSGVGIESVESAPGGKLLRVSGKGVLQLGHRRYRIETGADEDTPDVRLFASGRSIRSWHLGGNIPIYCGKLTFFGQLGAAPAARIASSEVKRSPGRVLGSEIVEWVRNDETLTRISLVRLPSGTLLRLKEEGPGCVVFDAEGLSEGWRVRVRAGIHEAAGQPVDGRIRLTLETQEAAPGVVHLKLSEPSTGRRLEVQSVWPTRSGMILDPDGMRLSVRRGVSVEELYGWRAIVPERTGGDLYLHMTGHRVFWLPLTGETPLASTIPIMRAMLAQGGPDAQVNLSLFVGGWESQRLEVRRYHGQAVVRDGTLLPGLDREQPDDPDRLADREGNGKRTATLHAVDLERIEEIGPVETNVPVNLEDVLGNSGGPWLIQSRFDGQLQRAVVWNPLGSPGSTRENRVRAYAGLWERLMSQPEDPEWDRLGRLVLSVGQHGDAGALDQVQALEKVPVAAVSLALRAARGDLAQILELDTATPLLWSTVLVSAFTEAVTTEHARWQARLAPYLGVAEAETEADTRLVRRIGDILALRPELAGHFCNALVDSGLFYRVIRIPEHQERLAPVLDPDPIGRLTEAAQEAARRCDRVPPGVGGLVPHRRPAALPEFNTHVQKMIDAPVVAAEMAAGLRAQPKADEKLALINLRFVDPLYFDAALPAALNVYAMEGTQ